MAVLQLFMAIILLDQAQAAVLRGRPPAAPLIPQAFMVRQLADMGYKAFPALVILGILYPAIAEILPPHWSFSNLALRPPIFLKFRTVATLR
jgi:hypothetical protein